MRLLVGIPAYNEGATIAEVVRAIPKALDHIDAISVLVVDDGSSDDTAERAAAAGAQVVRHPGNRGLGAAFQTLVLHALATGADVLVTLDGDGQFDPGQIPALLAPIWDGRALVCTASRFLDPALTPQMPWVKRWGNDRVAGLVSAMTGRRYADVSCGYRAYAREALLRLTVHGTFTYTHETFLDLAARGISFHEVPLPVRGVRAHGQSRMAASVVRYGRRAALILLRTYRDHFPLRLGALVAAPLAVLGTGLLGRSFYVFRETGSWLKWAAFVGGAALACAVATLLVAFLADMATRLRRNQEEALYWLRRQAYAAVPPAGATSAPAPAPSPAGPPAGPGPAPPASTPPPTRP